MCQSFAERKTIASSLDRIRQTILESERRFDRPAHSVNLIAVSKNRQAHEIEAAFAHGQVDFAENYFQEALAKIQALDNDQLCWHFIGRIQSNKAKWIARQFDWVHSVDRYKIAALLSESRLQEQVPLNVCIQVNISEEASKSGVRINEVHGLIDAIKSLPRLRIRGLMALPLATDDFNVQCSNFAKLRHCFLALQDRLDYLDTLSMGTTQDMLAAIAEGATHVRIGRGIFT